MKNTPIAIISYNPATDTVQALSGGAQLSFKELELLTWAAENNDELHRALCSEVEDDSELVGRSF